MPGHTYKLTYFKARGAGELSRLVFKAAGKEFTDERVEGEVWQNLKPSMPMQALPVLEIDGKLKICQSHAIARYLASEFGLMGSDNIEAVRIGELEEALVEMFNKEIYKIFGEKDDTKKKELATKFGEEALPKYLNFVEMRLKENKNKEGFFVGSKLSYGDLLMYDAFTMLKKFLGNFGVEVLKGRKLLQDHFDRVGAVPAIAAWVKARPESNF